MVKTVSKSELKQSLLLCMKAGDKYLVECADFNDCNRASSIVRLTSRRFLDDLNNEGIERLKVEMVKNENKVMIEAIPMSLSIE